MSVVGIVPDYRKLYLFLHFIDHLYALHTRKAIRVNVVMFILKPKCYRYNARRQRASSL